VGSNRALAESGPLAVSVQVAVLPLQLPAQPWNAEAPSGDARRFTLDPRATDPAQPGLEPDVQEKTTGLPAASIPLPDTVPFP